MPPPTAVAAPSPRTTIAERSDPGSVTAAKCARLTSSRVRTPAASRMPTSAASWARWSPMVTDNSTTDTDHERRWPRRTPRASIMRLTPARATRAPAACDSPRGRNCSMRCKWLRSGGVTASSRSTSPVAKMAKAAIRRVRRTRVRSPEVSLAGGQVAPWGHEATWAGWTSGAALCPFTTLSALTNRSRAVEVGRSASPRSSRTWRSAPVSSSIQLAWRWCTKTGGSPQRRRVRAQARRWPPGRHRSPGRGGTASGRVAPPMITPRPRC